MTHRPFEDFRTDIERGGVIQIPAGTYSLSSFLIIKSSHTRIFGKGLVKIIKTKKSAVVIESSGCCIESINIIGDGKAGDGICIRGDFNSIVRCNVYGNGGHGICIDGQRDYPIRHGNLVDGYRGNSVKRCRIEKNELIGISQYNHHDGTIAENYISENGLEGVTVDVWSHRNSITGNTLINNCRRDKGVAAIGIDFAHLNRFIGNFVEQTKYSKFGGIGFQNNVGKSEYNIVNSNTFVNCKYGVNLKSNSKGGTDHPAVENSPRTSNYNVVVGNVFRGIKKSSVKIGSGSKGNIVENNT